MAVVVALDAEIHKPL